MENVVSIVATQLEQGHSLSVVVSAMSGVTNLLLESAHQAEAGNETFAHQARAEIEQKHATATRHFLGNSPEYDQVMTQINALLDEFTALCYGIRVLGELTPRALDVIAALGERMNVIQVAAVLRHRGISAQAVVATRLIVTDDRFGAAVPKIPETAEKTQAVLGPMFEAGLVPVITGFVAATVDGIQTTLGRGGSDYSATIIGRAIQANEVWIWTDVNGVMTADPRLVPNAQTISQLSYAEISDLSFFGAKVLHSQAIRPARREEIPVRILNTFNPDHPGTLITAESSNGNKPVKAVTAIKGMSLVTLEGPGMIGITGVAGRLFTTVAQAKANVVMFSQASSEQAICLVISTSDTKRASLALEHEFAREIERRDVNGIRLQNDIVVLAVVGATLRNTPGISGRLFTALGREDINVIAIAQADNSLNVSVVIHSEDADRAIKAIHSEFQLGKAG